MACNHDALLLFWSGELPRQERAAMERHLHGCPGCRKELDSLRALGRLFRELPEPAPGAACSATPTPRVRRPGLRPAFAWAAAAMLLAALISGYLFTRIQQPGNQYAIQSLETVTTRMDSLRNRLETIRQSGRRAPKHPALARAGKACERIADLRQRLKRAASGLARHNALPHNNSQANQGETHV